MNKLEDVTVGGANYMLGYLQMIIAAEGCISPQDWKKALDATLAFEKRMLKHGGAAK
jgi:hypothetical protein